jgi:hypothetical protein
MGQRRRPRGHCRQLGVEVISKAFENRLRMRILAGTAALLTFLMVSLVTPPSVAQAVPLSTGEAIAQPLLQPGDSGLSVESLQQKLAQHGLYRGTVDGVYGAGTAEAVRSLQRQQGLTIDGIAGAETWQALASLSGVTPLPAPLLRADLLTLTPLVVAAPLPPPSALWLALMPMVPVTGGLITYLYQRFQRRQQLRRRRRRLPPQPRLPR